MKSNCINYKKKIEMKKGIMFSVIMFFLAVTLVGLIAVQRSLVSYSRERMFIETRIRAINNHYDSVMRDLGKTIEGSTQRAIIACLNNISSDNVPLSEANTTIRELILNGELDGNTNILMVNETIPYWIQLIEDVSTLRGFDVDIDTGMINKTLVVKPYSSFYLLVESDVGINITDIQGASALNRTTQIKKTVSIEGLEDPLYVLYFQGLSSNYVWESPYVGNYTQLLFAGSDGGNGYEYGNTTNDTSDFIGKILVTANYIPAYDVAKGIISETPIDPVLTPISKPYVIKSGALSLISEGTPILVDGENHNVWYIDNFKKHVEGKDTTEIHHSYYQASEDGPSYLDRLEGKFEIQDKYKTQSDKTIGLESFVDKTIFPGGFSPVQERTNIDYLYFSSTLTGDGVKGISNSNWFRIDNELAGSVRRQEIYNVTNLIE